MSRMKRPYFVWNTDYPEEGSQVWDAKSATEARRLAAGNGWDDYDTLSARKVSAKDIEEFQERLEGTEL